MQYQPTTSGAQAPDSSSHARAQQRATVAAALARLSLIVERALQRALIYDQAAHAALTTPTDAAGRDGDATATHLPA